MDFLRLLLGLFLPWAGAYFWICATEDRFNGRCANRYRQLGLSYFFGLMVVFGLLQVQSWALGNVSYYLTIGLLAVFTLTGFLVHRITRPEPFPVGPPESRLQLGLFWLFGAWCVLHLVLAGIEIWHRPVFPWDAWQTWIYRAKAWFHAGSILPMDKPVTWELGTGVSDYNAAGANYPLFVSVIALWAALSLDRWHESLKNLPTLLCGIAMAMAMYGLAREAAFPRWLSALAIYLLLSIPLLGTHLALAGQADIWQTAYTGLGFAALLLGIIGARNWLAGVGLFMALLGVLVKNEGLIWFLTALALLGLSRRPRWTLYSAGLVATLILVAWVTGFHYFELPGLGRIGLTDGRVYIPGIGSFQIMMFDLWDDYRSNFFMSRTWHLLWPMLLLAAVGLLKLPDRKARNAIFILASLVMSCQIIVFVFSEHGLWAEDWTAINRLPMHIAPVAILSLLIYFRLSSDVYLCNGGGWQWLSTSVALVITLILCTLYLTILYPSTDAEPEEFSAKQLSIVVGDGHIKDEVGVINKYENTIAVVSGGHTTIDTSQLSILEVKTTGPNRSPRRFFWRNGPGEEDLHSINIGRGVGKYVHLGSSENWTGVVSEVGLLLYEDDDRWVEIRSISLQPRTLTNMLAITWQNWTTMGNWNQRSVNYVSTGEASAPLNLTVLLTSWIAITTLLALLLTRLAPAPPERGIALAAILGWLLLDLRWTSELIDRAVRTVAYYQAEQANHIDLGNDKALKALAEKTRPYLDQTGTPVLIVAESDNLDFEALRAKYHLLPLAAHVIRGATLSSPPRLAADHVLVLRMPALAPGERRAGARYLSTVLSDRLGRSYVSVFDDPAGVLLKATPSNVGAK